MRWREHGIEHRLTNVDHPWTNGPSRATEPPPKGSNSNGKSTKIKFLFKLNNMLLLNDFFEPCRDRTGGVDEITYSTIAVGPFVKIFVIINRRRSGSRYGCGG